MLLTASEEMESLDLQSTNRTCDSLQCYGWEVMDHTPCKTDLAATDFHLFWALIGKRFETNADVKQAVWHWLFLRWDKSPSATVGQMLNVDGENSEVWCAPSATCRPNPMHRSENKFSASECYLIVQRIRIMISTFLLFWVTWSITVIIINYKRKMS